MKRINNRAIAVEAVLTRHGTVVGPFMTELTGHSELTPYKGGWCGNEMYPDALSGPARIKANQLVRRLGDRLAGEGYKGFFEVDVLVDIDDDEVYLGELNPRISGASSITNVTAGAYSDMPLFLFHLLEYMGVEYELDVDEINERWEDLASVDLWSQMVIKETVAGRRAADRGAADRSVVHRRQRRTALPAGRAGLAPAAERERMLLPADLRARRLPLEGRGSRGAGDQGSAADRGAGGSGLASALVGAASTTPVDVSAVAQAVTEEAKEPPVGIDLVSEHESDAAPRNAPATAGGPSVAGSSRLTPRAIRLIQAIRAQYAGTPVGAEFTAPVSPVGIKSGG